MPPLYLASTSPRRAALLNQLGLLFQTIAPTIEEAQVRSGSSRDAGRAAMANALTKAKVVAAQLTEGLVLAGDTLVLTDKGKSLGKPQTVEDAIAMLRQLAGTWHRVLSAVAVVDARTGKSRVRLASARVWFRPAQDATLRRYAATGEPLDKAGGYAIQGLGSYLVARVSGSYTAVIGFPLELVVDLLEEFRFVVPDHWAKADSLSRRQP